MKIKYRPEGINNFHNSASISLVVTDPIRYEDGSQMYRISVGQRRRIERHFCGVSDCHCPHGSVQEIYPDEYAIPAKYVI